MILDWSYNYQDNKICQQVTHTHTHTKYSHYLQLQKHTYICNKITSHYLVEKVGMVTESELMSLTLWCTENHVIKNIIPHILHTLCEKPGHSTKEASPWKSCHKKILSHIFCIHYVKSLVTLPRKQAHALWHLWQVCTVPDVQNTPVMIHRVLLSYCVQRCKP